MSLGKSLGMHPLERIRTRVFPHIPRSGPFGPEPTGCHVVLRRRAAGAGGKGGLHRVNSGAAEPRAQAFCLRGSCCFRASVPFGVYFPLRVRACVRL
jgi:hypothetical protein